MKTTTVSNGASAGSPMPDFAFVVGVGVGVERFELPEQAANTPAAAAPAAVVMNRRRVICSMNGTFASSEQEVHVPAARAARPGVSPLGHDAPMVDLAE